MSCSLSFYALVTVELKIPRRYLYYFNHANFSESVECVSRFIKKCFRIDRDELDHVPMKGLVSKPVRIHLGLAEEI